MDKTILISLHIDDLQSLIIDCVNSCLEHQEKPQKKEFTEKLLTVQEAAQFLNLSVPTIYSKCSKGELPCMKRGGRLYFSNKELMGYVKQGKRKSNYEIEEEAENYLTKKKN